MKLKPNLAISETGFIFDPTTGESFSTNSQGVEIIHLLNGNNTEQEIKQYFMKEYEVDETTFERSYLDFVSMLRLYNLITENNE